MDRLTRGLDVGAQTKDLYSDTRLKREVPLIVVSGDARDFGITCWRCSNDETLEEYVILNETSRRLLAPHGLLGGRDDANAKTGWISRRPSREKAANLLIRKVVPFRLRLMSFTRNGTNKYFNMSIESAKRDKSIC